VNGSIKYREEGAKNLEAYIQDERDGKKYRIVKMPDGNWWMAENLNYQKDLVMNEKSDSIFGKEYFKKPNGIEAIGSFWCNDGLERWSIFDIKNYDTFTNEEKDFLLKKYGYKPTLQEVEENYPGEKGSNNELNRIRSCSNYGALYTWETANTKDGKEDWEKNISIHDKNSNGICPKGWGIPSDEDWGNMLDYVEKEINGLDNHKEIQLNSFKGQYAGMQLKSKYLQKNNINISTGGGFIWQDKRENIFDKYDYLINGTVSVDSDELYKNEDYYGFTIYPTGGKFVHSYMGTSTSALFWTSTESSKYKAIYRSFDNNSPRVYRGEHEKYFGLSVRCLKK
jgi:uncharacterized protein (TIGR02145 family)